MTESEKVAWAGLTTAAQAHEFIDMFWYRRDPDLETRENEFRTDFEARVELADARFAEPDLRGALTDRGKTLILLGVPSETTQTEIGTYLADLYRTGRPPRASASDPQAHIQMQGVTFNLTRGRADVWSYHRDHVPSGIEWPSRDGRISFAFFDHEGTGQFRMQLGIRRSAAANVVLTAAPDALNRHALMSEPPVFPLVQGLPAATEEELLWLESPEMTTGIVAEVVPGFAGAGEVLGWLSVRLPMGSPVADVLIGRLSAKGEVVGSLRVAVDPIADASGSLIELAFPAPVGPSVFDYALACDHRVVHAERLDLVIDDPSDTVLSPIFAGVEVRQAFDATAGQPFVFGGYHLNYRADGRFWPGEDLALFCLLTSNDEVQGPRSGSVSMRWHVDGQESAVQPPQPVQLAPAGPSTWVWGTQLPLSELSPGSRYTLTVVVTDSESGLSRETDLPITIVATDS